MAVLTSWKDIAQFVGKGVRTVQRWERNLGLPVRRVGAKNVVVAIPEEIEAWVRSHQSQCGRAASDREGEIARLLRTISELRAENASLRDQLARAFRSHTPAGHAEPRTSQFRAEARQSTR